MLRIGNTENGFMIRVLINTGADKTLINSELQEALKESGAVVEAAHLAVSTRLIVPTGNQSSTPYQIELTIGVRNSNLSIPQVLIVPNFTHEVILGMNILGNDITNSINDGHGILIVNNLPTLRMIHNRITLYDTSQSRHVSALAPTGLPGI